MWGDKEIRIGDQGKACDATRGVHHASVAGSDFAIFQHTPASSTLSESLKIEPKKTAHSRSLIFLKGYIRFNGKIHLVGILLCSFP